ncbi:MAG: hypothetical protein ACKO15_02130, partial [Burkholderiales bacterium]
LPPEKTIYGYLKDLVDRPEAHPIAWEKLQEKMLSTNQLRVHFLEGEWSMANRDATKKWWRAKSELIAQYGIIELWASQHAQAVSKFEQSFENAAAVVAARI